MHCPLNTIKKIERIDAKLTYVRDTLKDRLPLHGNRLFLKIEQEFQLFIAVLAFGKNLFNGNFLNLEICLLEFLSEALSLVLSRLPVSIGWLSLFAQVAGVLTKP